jgi:hypothetical protein
LLVFIIDQLVAEALMNVNSDIIQLREEDRVLKAQLRNQRPLMTDGERRRLAVLGARLGRRPLAEVAMIVTPDTIFSSRRRVCRRRVRFAVSACARESSAARSEPLCTHRFRRR